MSASILVTGGAGFIGSKLVADLVGQGHHVVILDDLSNGSLENINLDSSTFVNGSITDSLLVDQLFKENSFDFAFHLAARGSVPRSIKDPKGTLEVNLLGTQNILMGCLQKKTKFIFSSSSSVYGSNPKLPKRESDWTDPISPYGASKLSSEYLIKSFHHAYGLPIQVFRFFNVFGPGQSFSNAYSAVIPKWIKACIKGDPIILEGDGEQSRDFTYVDDLTRVLTLSISEDIDRPNLLNLAFGRSYSLREIIDHLEMVFPNIFVEVVPPREGDVRKSLSDPSLLLKFFPQARQTPFEIALRNTVHWVQARIK